MTTVYINYHPTYGYAMAVIDGFVDLRDYVQNTDWLCWAPSPRGKRQVMISRVYGVPDGELPRAERVDEFVKYVTNLGAKVLVRDERGDEWKSWIDFSDNLQ